MRSLPLLLCFIFITAKALAGGDFTPVFTLREPLQSTYTITKEMQQLDDASCALTFGEALRSTQFKTAPFQTDASTGYCGWRRIAFRNDAPKAVFYELQLPWLDTVELYEVTEGKAYAHLMGKLVPHNAKLVVDAYNAFPVVLQPGQTRTFYVRIKTDGFYKTLNPSLSLQSEFNYRSHWYFWGAYFGVLVLLLVISAGLTILFKDWKYTLLALPIVGVLLFFGDFNGDLHVYLNTSPVFAKYFNAYITSWVFPVSFFVFIIFYTSMRRKLPWAFYTTIVASAGITTGYFVDNLFFGHRIYDYINYSSLATDLLLLIVLVWLAVKKDREAKLILVFLAPLMITAFYMEIYMLLGLSGHLHMMQLTQIASLISALIIGYELYHRVRSTINERLRVLQLNQQLMLDQNIMLEEKVRERTKQLEAEKQKSDDLLLNILPAEVAEELKNRGNTEAKLFDEVTVMFTDFVNFTKAAEAMTPKELVNELDTCFKAFDEIIGRHGIEKIKTIGDAYLAVAGLPVADECHATNMVNAALEINAFMLGHKQRLGEHAFEVRIGIHSGSVVAGIVGVKKFAYDIWGDTVNTAARMEQASEPGKINISQVTYELVKNSFNCNFRGEITAKNKGAMKMYFVESRV